MFLFRGSLLHSQSVLGENEIRNMDLCVKYVEHSNLRTPETI